MKTLFRSLKSLLSGSSRSSLADSASPTRSLELDALEPRVLFSGAPVEVADTDASETVETAAPAPDGNATSETQSALSQAKLQDLAQAATERWIQSGLSAEQAAALQNITYQVADLSGQALGSASGNTITIDIDAAGHGWFVDSTPSEDSEFSISGEGSLFATGQLSGQMDLLTTLLHEQGHILGLADATSGSTNLLTAWLSTGERRLPVAGQATGAIAGSIEGISFLTAQTNLSGITEEGQIVSIDALTASFNQIANLEANPTIAQLQRFGHSVAVSGDLAVIGSDDTGDTSYVLVYQREGGVWNFKQAIQDPDGINSNDDFGYDVAVDGQSRTIVIGAYVDDDGGTDSGTIYVFTDLDNDNIWTLSQEINSTSGLPGIDGADNFGISVAVDNDGAGNFRIVVGAHVEDTWNDATGASNGTNSGALYIFRDTSATTNGSSFVFEQRLKAEGLADRNSGDNFGRGVDIDGNFIISVAQNDDEFQTNAGAAYVFEYDTTASHAVIEINSGTVVVADAGLRFSSKGGPNNNLTIQYVTGGASTTASALGDTITVTLGAGATAADVKAAIEGNLDTDTLVSVAFFNGNGTGAVSATQVVTFGQWTQTAKLVNRFATAASDQPMSAAVTESGGDGLARVVVGARLNDQNGGNNGGAGLVYVKVAGSWYLEDIFQPNDIATGGDDQFGTGVDILGDVLAISSFADDTNGETNQGSVYLFKRDTTQSSAFLFNAGTVENTGIRVYAADTNAIGNVFVQLINPGVATATTTAVLNGLTIEVTLAHSGSAITATSAQVAAAINAAGLTVDLTGFGGGAAVAITAATPANGNGQTLGTGATVVAQAMVDAGPYAMTAHWTQEIKLIGSELGNVNDRGGFGREVALSANSGDPGSFFLLAGEPFRDTFLPGETITVNGTAQPVKLGEMGGAYLFSGSASDPANTTTEVAILKPEEIANATDHIMSRLTGINEYGLIVDIVGNIAVVGAPGGGGQSQQEGNTIGDNTGDVYIFVRNDQGTIDLSDDTWDLFQTIRAVSEPGAGDDFGRDVALSRDQLTLAIGAPLLDHDGAILDNGAVYVYTRANTSAQFAQSAFIHFNGPGLINGATGVIGNENQQLGYNLDISDNGSRIVAGAYAEDFNSENNRGAVYIIDRPTSGNWANVNVDYNNLPATVTRLIASDGAASSNFGRDVAISGDGTRVVIGAYLDDTGGADRGKVYTYDLSSAVKTDWQGTEVAFQPTAAAPGGGTAIGNSDDLGMRIGLAGTSGEWLVVSAHLDDDAGSNGGAVYVYQLQAGSYVLQQKLNAVPSGTVTLTNAEFGRAVAINEDATLIAVGARGDDNFGTDVGAVYVFQRDASKPVGQQWILRDGPIIDENRDALGVVDGTDNFGRSIAISGSTVIAGGYNADRIFGNVPVRNYGVVSAFDVSPIADPGGTLQVQSGGFGAITNLSNPGRIANGTVSVVGGRIVFNPGSDFLDLEPGESEEVTFTYTLEDTVNSQTSIGRVTITVRGVNDAPTFSNDPSSQPSGYQTSEDAVLNNSDAATTGLLANDNDPEGHAQSVTAVNGSASAVGSTITLASGAQLTVAADGTFSYDASTSSSLQSLNNGETATDTFTYTAEENFVFNDDGNFLVEAFNIIAGGGANDTALSDTNETITIWNHLDGLAESNRDELQTVGTKIYNVANYHQVTLSEVNLGDAQVFPNTLNYTSVGMGIGVNQFSVRSTSYLTFNTAGTYTIAIGSDDSRRLSLTGVDLTSGSPFAGLTFGGQFSTSNATSATQVANSGAHRWTAVEFQVAAGDVLMLEAIFSQATGGKSQEIAIASGSQAATVDGTVTTLPGTFELLVDDALNGGTSGNGVQLSSSQIAGGTSGSATVTLTITGLNDAPVLGGGVADFNDVGVSQFDNDGDLVSTLINGQITDVDTGSIEGIAITGTSVAGSGKFQFSTNGGSSWSDVGTVSDASALLLRPTDRVRFIPDGSTVTDSTLTFRAWDQTGTTAGQEGTKVDASTNGGTTAFSTDARTVSVSIAELIKDGNEIVYAPIAGEVNTLTVRFDSKTGELVFTDTSSVIGSGFSGGGTNTVRILLAAGDNLTIETGDGDDTITIGNLGFFDGSLTVDGEEGQDRIILNRTSLNLAADNDARFTSEEFDAILASLTTQGTGSITINATGSSGGASYQVGIDLLGSTLRADGTGSINLIGQGGATGTNNQGIQLTNGSSISTADGDITLVGTGGNGTSHNQGIMLHSGSSIAAGGSGNLDMNGQGGDGASFNDGIFIIAGSSASSVDGLLSIDGTGGNGSALGNRGVQISTSSVSSSGNGNIEIVGLGNGSDSHNTGILLNASDLNATGTGSISLQGIGSTAGNSYNQGIKISQGTISTAAGDISIDGTGNGSALYNSGVGTYAGATISAGGSGNLTVNGTGGNGTAYNEGVLLSANSNLSSNNGAIAISGTGNGSTTGNRGIQINGRSQVRSTGSGTVTLIGSGSLASTGSYNSGIFSSTGSVQANSGNLSITGNGGSGSSYNIGVRLIGGSYQSTSGSLNVTGFANGSTTGLHNYGVWIQGAAVGGGSGNSVNGTGGGGTGFNHGVFANSVTGTLAAGDVTGSATDGNTNSKNLTGNFFS